MNEDYEDEDYEDEDNVMILSVGDDGKAEIHKPENFISMSVKDVELMKGFIEANSELFKEYCKSKGCFR